MSTQIIEMLKNAINTRTRNLIVSAEILRNIAKEELQYYVLNFIYHHPRFSKWTMYGGSALRICHKLDRMSVDLDFEIDEVCNKELLNALKKDLELHFANKYDLESELFTIRIISTSGLRLRFILGEELGISYHSQQVFVSIDLHHFAPPFAGVERIPINHNQLSFVIKSYNLSTLMASKIAAILLRGERRIGKSTYYEKGRDIYDLCWYLEREIIPNLSYLQARTKDQSIINLRVLFDRLTVQMNKVSDKNLQDDLMPLFLNQEYINNWLKQWRESYHRAIKLYKIYTVTNLDNITIDYRTSEDVYYFTYSYHTQENCYIKIIYPLSGFFFEDQDMKISIKVNDSLEPLIHRNFSGKRKIEMAKQYATLFYLKNVTYFKKHKNIALSIMQTKIICTQANNDQDKIMLNRKTLLTCELESLLR